MPHRARRIALAGAGQLAQAVPGAVCKPTKDQTGAAGTVLAQDRGVPACSHDQLLALEWDLPLLESPVRPAARRSARDQLLAVQWELPALDFFPPAKSDEEIAKLVAEVSVALGVKPPVTPRPAAPERRLVAVADPPSQNLRRPPHRLAPPPLPGWAFPVDARGMAPYRGSSEITVSLSVRCA